MTKGNSGLSLQSHGDVLERTYSEFITINFPSYSQIWSEYIGNDGSATLLPATGLNQKEQSDREYFSQYHYTIAESMICMQEIIDQINKLEIKEVKSYLSINNLFLAFQAHTGRVRDCLNNIGYIFNLHDLSKDLDDLYRKRNNALHGCKIPFMIIDGFVMLPDIQGDDQSGNKWNDKKLWSDVDLDDSNSSFLNDFLETSFRDIVAGTQSGLSRLYTEVHKFVKEKGFVLSPGSDESYSINPSGIMVDNHISSSVWFDGGNVSGSTDVYEIKK
jgi:hypothetical protein